MPTMIEKMVNFPENATGRDVLASTNGKSDEELALAGSFPLPGQERWGRVSLAQAGALTLAGVRWLTNPAVDGALTEDQVLDQPFVKTVEGIRRVKGVHPNSPTTSLIGDLRNESLANKDPNDELTLVQRNRLIKDMAVLAGTETYGGRQAHIDEAIEADVMGMRGDFYREAKEVLKANRHGDFDVYYNTFHATFGKWQRRAKFDRVSGQPIDYSDGAGSTDNAEPENTLGLDANLEAFVQKASQGSAEPV